jgi:hypothetical protein
MSIEPKTSFATDEVAHDKPETDRLTSTAEVARDLENQEASARRSAEEDKSMPLFPENETTNYRNRWTEIQTAFVDEPRRAVEQADSLVAEVIKRLATTFADERSKLEGQWGRGNDVSTEELRVALQRYRAFFDHLLTV